jgi:hypothetical protein
MNEVEWLRRNSGLCSRYRTLRANEGGDKSERPEQVCGEIMMMIDFTDKIDLPDEMKGKFFNELQTLANIWRGMCFIYRLACDIEHSAGKKIEEGAGFKTMPAEVRKLFEGKEIRYVSAGNDPAFEWLDKGLVYSLFQWYAVSACNYVRLVGQVAKETDSSRPDALAYVEKVIPKVKWFRDKIAAHHARGSKDKDKRDNEADRTGSVLYQVGYDSGRFYAPVWEVTIVRKGEQIAGTNPGCWSITETHGKLRERYRRET